MIYSLTSYTYKNNIIWLMVDTGAHWYLVEEEYDSKTFYTLEQAKHYIDGRGNI